MAGKKLVFDPRAWVGVLWVVWCGHGLADSKQYHSAVTVKPQLEGANLQLDFAVAPGDNMQLTYEGPWKLDLGDASGIKLEKKVYTKADLQQSLPGFQVKAQVLADQTPVSLPYKLTAFACTKDKKQCFRDVHEGTYKMDQSKPTK